MSAAGVVAKAKAHKLKISRALVYVVRGSSQRKAKPVSAKPKLAPSTATTAPGSMSKAAFIRSLPATLSVKDVVATGKAKGIKFDATYVYWARRATTKRAKTTTRRATSPGNGAPLGRPASTSSSAEALLLALGAEIGLGKAVEILEGERAKVRAAIGG